MPTEEEIREIISLWDDGNGLSHGQIARRLNYNQSTITRVINKLCGPNRDAQGHAHESEHQCKTKHAREAKRTYDRERRLALNDRLFERLELFLEEKVTARDYKDLMISYGILEDKRSLLEPPQVDSMNSGLAEMREAIHEERLNGLETVAKDVQSG